MRVDHGRHGISCVVKPVNEFEPQCDQQRNPKQNEGADGKVLLARVVDVAINAECCVTKPSHKDQQEGNRASYMGFRVQLRPWRSDPR
jgi:hypothetical protein